MVGGNLDIASTEGSGTQSVTIVDTSTEAGLGFPHSFLHPHVVTKEGWREAEVAPDADH